MSVSTIVPGGDADWDDDAEFAALVAQFDENPTPAAWPAMPTKRQSMNRGVGFRRPKPERE